MTELAVSAADTVKIAVSDAGIAPAKTAVTAFLGRALRGPVDHPVTLYSFDDYRRVFGGLWQPSMLSYAVEQYFAHGGRECIVVRVCNGGRPPTLRLPAGAGHALTLAGVAPGTREFLRASVDYDGIAEADHDRFNLVLQRVRAQGSELIEAQEIFRRVSIRPDAERSVADALRESRLARVAGPLPPVRPDRSSGAPRALPVGYTWADADGDDGDELTSYDIVGDAQRGTGLFALRGAEPFNFLHIPPLAREREVGLPALLVALRLCRERRAQLLLDPPLAWSDPALAVAGLARWPILSADALMFYPRIVAPDRLRGHEATFGGAASAAGLIAAASERRPPWSAAADEPLLLRSPCVPACAVSDLDRIRLTQGGVNLLHSAREPGRSGATLRTLLPEGSSGEWRYASARRFALFIANSIEAGTRWALCEPRGPQLWAELRARVTAFFHSLEQEGAFAGRHSDENSFVICDERLNDPAKGPGIRLLYGVAVVRPGDFHTCLVSHELSGSAVRAVSVNRYALPPAL